MYGFLISTVWPTRCKYFLKDRTGDTAFLTQGCHNTHLSREARWCAWCQCNHSWFCYGVLKYLRLICPLLAGERLPIQRSPVLSHSWVTMSCGSIGLCLKAFLFPVMQLEPKFFLAVELEIWAIADLTTGECCLYSDFETFNTDVLISACCFWLTWLCWPPHALLALPDSVFPKNKTSGAGSNWHRYTLCMAREWQWSTWSGGDFGVFVSPENVMPEKSFLLNHPPWSVHGSWGASQWLPTCSQYVFLITESQQPM